MAESPAPHTVRKVPFQIFTITIAFLGGIMLVIAGYLFTEIATLKSDIGREIASMQGEIKALDAKLELQGDRSQAARVDLAEIKATLQYLKEAADSRPPRR